MVTIVWSFLMPLFLAVLVSLCLISRIFIDKPTKKAILIAREVLMSEREQERTNENIIIRCILDSIARLQKIIDIEQPFLSDLRNMLTLMGLKRRAEKELARQIFNGFIGALPVLIVPILTGFEGYVLLYPIFVVVVAYQQNMKLKKEYKKWQVEMTKDLPEIIDKLRISFASGRDYISAFNQAKENSGPRIRNLIDKLINDLQCMRPAYALDLFAQSFNMPVVTKFTSAVKIAIEYGYGAAENYFRIIEDDITEIRRVAIEELTKSKPEKVYQLYLILLILAIGSLSIKGWEIFSQINKIM
jgi:Flp pilus assembly protein TadB